MNETMANFTKAQTNMPNLFGRCYNLNYNCPQLLDYRGFENIRHLNWYRILNHNVSNFLQWLPSQTTVTYPSKISYECLLIVFQLKLNSIQVHLRYQPTNYA